MSKSEDYDEDYFVRGRESGKSLYSNYRWLPDLTVPMCRAIAEHCGMAAGCSVLDYGCARGYSVRAMRGLGYDARGVDVSEWAVRNADPHAAPYLDLIAPGTTPLSSDYDWVVAKDVLEHCEYVDFFVQNLMLHARRGLFVVVPLTMFNGGQYVVREYEEDITHIQRMDLPTWAEMFVRVGWSVTCAYRVPGVKDNYAYAPTGNGFITCRRVEG